MLATIIHDVYSNVKLNEFIDVTLAFPEIDIIVISKASSVAAQTGVPTAEKKVYVKNKRLLYLPDLSDVKDILSLSKLYLIVPKKLSKKRLDFEVLKKVMKNERVGIAVSGSESSFTAREMELGMPVDIGIESPISPSANIAIILYELFISKEVK